MPDALVNEYKKAPTLKSGPDPKSVSAIAEALVAAKRPVIVAGQGVHYAKAWPQLKALADLVGGRSPGVIGVLGEAGLGKSRLCFEATAMAVSAGRRVVQVRGVSMNSATPFAPLRASVTQLLLLDEGQPEDEVRARLEGVGLEAMEAAGVASILGIAQAGNVWKAMSADARKQAITHGLARTIQSAAARLPLLLIIEDLHDFDQETLACLRAAFRGDDTLCAIVTSRP